MARTSSRPACETNVGDKPRFLEHGVGKRTGVRNLLVIFDHVRTDPQRSTFYNGPSPYRFVKRGISRIVPGNNRVSFLLNLVITALLCRIQFRQQQIDVVISGDPRIAFAVGIVNRLSRAQVRHVVWNFNAHRVYRGVRRSIARFALRDVERLVVYSTHERDVYAAMLNLSLERVVFKHYSGPYLEDPRYAELAGAKENYVVSAGYSGRNYKDLAAIARLLRDIPFLVLTYPGAVQGLSFPPNVRIISGIPEVEYCRHIARGKVFLLPLANKETANGQIALAQAMALRTLLVTNPTEGTRDYLRPGENCLLYDETDVPAAAALIRSSLANDSLREQIVLNAYRYAMEHFVIRRDLEVLQEILASVSSTVPPRGHRGDPS